MTHYDTLKRKDTEPKEYKFYPNSTVNLLNHMHILDLVTDHISFVRHSQSLFSKTNNTIEGDPVFKGIPSFTHTKQVTQTMVVILSTDREGDPRVIYKQFNYLDLGPSFQFMS